MSKEITITNTSNTGKYISFRVKGLSNGILISYNKGLDSLSIAYKGDVLIVPFNATSEDIIKINNA